jgi:hypothetical protein
MGEDVLKVELPKATGEAGGSGEPRLRPTALRLPVYERIEPLRPTLGRHPPLLAALRPEYAPNPADHLPQLEPDIPRFDPVMIDQRLREVRGAPQQHAENLIRMPKFDDWAHAQRTLNQRERRGRSVEHNPRDQLPVMPLAAPILRPQENRVGGVGTDPVDRGRVDRRRRRAVDPGDGAAP